MFTFKQFFLLESPDFATFTVNGLQYNFKLGSHNTDKEVCFTVFRNGTHFSSQDVTLSDVRNVSKYINALVHRLPSKTVPVYTHIEIKAVYLLKNNTIQNTKQFLSEWDKLQEEIEIEGRGWLKDDMWFVSLHNNNETPHFSEIFTILNTYEFYLETKNSTRYVNKDSFLPSSTPLTQRSPHLQKKIDFLRRRLHLATGNEKKAIASLLDYFDR